MVFRFADDMVLFAESIKELQYSLDIFHIYCSQLKLNVNPGLEVIKLEYSLSLIRKGNDWLLADTCPQAANHCALF